jgi:hypothetical protein
MFQEKLMITAFKQALGVTIYVVFVSILMNYGGKIVGDDKSFLGPVAFLMLFVISAAATGYLVVGKSILLYLDGAKKEAVRLFGLTILWLVLFMLLAFLGMALN